MDYVGSYQSGFHLVISVRISRDGGLTWSEPRQIAKWPTGGYSGTVRNLHPLSRSFGNASLYIGKLPNLERKNAMFVFKTREPLRRLVSMTLLAGILTAGGAMAADSQSARQNPPRQPVAIGGVWRAENLVTGEMTEKPASILLHLAPGDVIDIQFEDRSRRRAYVFLGSEPRPLKFSKRNIDKGSELLLHKPEGDEVVGLLSFNKDISPAQFERLCREYSGIRSFCVSISGRSQDVVDLGPLAHMSKLAALRSDYGTQVSDIGPLTKLPELALLDIYHSDRLTTLEPLGKLKNLRVLKVTYCKELRDIGALAKLTSLQRLNLHGCPYDKDDLAPLAGLEKLRYLEVDDCGLEDEIQPLAGLVNLTHLTIHEGRNLTSLAPLAGLTNLREIKINHVQKPLSLTPFSGMKKLQRLTVWGPTTEIGSLASCENLTNLFLGRVDKLEPLDGAKRLTELSIQGCTNLTDLKLLAGLASLKQLSLRLGCNVPDLKPLAELPNLEWLVLEYFEKVRDLTPLSGLEKLKFLKLSYCTGISDLSPLASLTNLDTLMITDGLLIGEFGDMGGLKPLADLATLRRLVLYNCPRLSDLSPLAGHPKLSQLSVRRCPNIRSLDQLGKMPALRRFHFSPERQFSREEVAALKKNNPQCKINPRW